MCLPPDLRRPVEIVPLFLSGSPSPPLPLHWPRNPSSSLSQPLPCRAMVRRGVTVMHRWIRRGTNDPAAPLAHHEEGLASRDRAVSGGLHSRTARGRRHQLDRGRTRDTDNPGERELDCRNFTESTALLHSRRLDCRLGRVSVDRTCTFGSWSRPSVCLRAPY